MDEDNKFWIIIGTLVIFFTLIIIIPLVIIENTQSERAYQLEKYKIEMQYKHGDVIEENK